MPVDDAKVADAARKFVKALEDLDQQGGDQAAVVNKCRLDLESAVRSEGESEAQS